MDRAGAIPTPVRVRQVLHDRPNPGLVTLRLVVGRQHAQLVITAHHASDPVLVAALWTRIERAVGA